MTDPAMERASLTHRLPRHGALGTTFRYIARELLATLGAVFLALLLIALGGRFIGYLQEAALGRYSADALLALAALRVPEFAQLTLPFALFLAALITAGRLHAEREFAVLLAAGLGPPRMLAWLLAIAAPIAALVAALSFALTPRAAAAFSELALAQRAKSEFEGILPGVFHTFSFDRRVTYAEAVDARQRRLQGVFANERLAGGAHVTTWARAGSQHIAPDTGSRFLLLEEGVRHEGVPGSADYRTVAFNRLSQRVELNPTPWGRLDPRTLPTEALDRANAEQAAEWHWRAGLPIATALATLCGFGFGRTPPRKGRFARLVPGMAGFLAYFLLCMAARGAIADGDMAAWLGLWPVHGAAAVLAAWLLANTWRPA